MDDVDAAKRRAGERAAEAVEDGWIVGLGTGSTAAYAIRELGRRADSGLDVRAIPTSYQSRRLAIEAGLELVALDEARPDVAIDGADQIAGSDCIKGGGAAHAREKIVASAADRFHVVVDATKEADRLDRSVPVEVLPFARDPVEATVEDLGGTPTLRAARRKDGPVVTDNGNLVLDCDFGTLDDPGARADDLSKIPGVVEHGLFLGMADVVYVGDGGVTVRRP